MKLKEAFRAQNQLSNRYAEACDLLSAVTFKKEVKTHLLSKANLGDDVVEEVAANVTAFAGDERYDFDKLVDLAMALAEEKEKLIVAIEKAKSDENISFDALKQKNVIKQSLINDLMKLSVCKTTEKQSFEEFYGKDNDGKQAIYRYPVKTVTSYDFDKNHLKAILRKLREESDATSLKLDQMLVNVEVDFNCRFNFDDTLEDIYLGF